MLKLWLALFPAELASFLGADNKQLKKRMTKKIAVGVGTTNMIKGTASDRVPRSKEVAEDAGEESHACNRNHKSFARDCEAGAG
jgi:hypothetical protein